MAKGPQLGALVVSVDPSLRWGDGARVVVNPPVSPHAKGFAYAARAALLMGCAHAASDA